MGTKGFDTFKTDLILNLNQRTDVATLVGGWVNTAYLDFCTRDKFWDLSMPKSFCFPELKTTDATQTTVAGTAYITTPSDCLRIYTVWDSTNDRKLDYMQARNYVDQTGRTTTAGRGKPSKWLRYGNRIYLWPTPAGAYAITVYYRKRPAILTGTDVTVIGAEWDEPILLLASAQASNRLNDFEKAIIWKKEFVEQVGARLQIYDAEDTDAEDYMTPDYTYLKGFGYR